MNQLLVTQAQTHAHSERNARERGRPRQNPITVIILVCGAHGRVRACACSALTIVTRACTPPHTPTGIHINLYMRYTTAVAYSIALQAALRRRTHTDNHTVIMYSSSPAPGAEMLVCRVRFMRCGLTASSGLLRYIVRFMGGRADWLCDRTMMTTTTMVVMATCTRNHPRRNDMLGGRLYGLDE